MVQVIHSEVRIAILGWRFGCEGRLRPDTEPELCAEPWVLAAGRGSIQCPVFWLNNTVSLCVQTAPWTMTQQVTVRLLCAVESIWRKVKKKKKCAYAPEIMIILVRHIREECQCYWFQVFLFPLSTCLCKGQSHQSQPVSYTVAFQQLQSLKIVYHIVTIKCH